MLRKFAIAASAVFLSAACGKAEEVSAASPRQEVYQSSEIRLTNNVRPNCIGGVVQGQSTNGRRSSMVMACN